MSSSTVSAASKLFPVVEPNEAVTTVSSVRVNEHSSGPSASPHSAPSTTKPAKALSPAGVARRPISVPSSKLKVPSSVNSTGSPLASTETDPSPTTLIDSETGSSTGSPPPLSELPQAASTSIAARLSDRVVNLFLKSPLIRSPFQPSSGEFLTGAYGPQFRVQRTGVPNVDAIAQANRDLAE